MELLIRRMKFASNCLVRGSDMVRYRISGTAYKASVVGGSVSERSKLGMSLLNLQESEAKRTGSGSIRLKPLALNLLALTAPELVGKLLSRYY